MKRKILILLFVLLCSGCSSIKYNISFGESIKEEVMVVDNNYHEDSLNLEDGFMDDMSAFEFFFQTLPYRTSSDENGVYYATKSFENGDEFATNSFVFTKLISSDAIKVKNKKISVKIDAYDVLNDYDLSSKNLEISLYIPYYVSKHNADKVSNNTYTWIIDDINSDSIKISFDMSKGTDFKNKVLAVIVVVILVIVIGIIIGHFVKRNKEVNEI